MSRNSESELWDPSKKPPSGRPKSALVKTSLPPRFQRREEDPRDCRDSRDRDVTFNRDVMSVSVSGDRAERTHVSMSSSWSEDRYVQFVLQLQSLGIICSQSMFYLCLLMRLTSQDPDRQR